MNNSYETIVNILKYSIKKQNYILDDNVINWGEFVEKADEHQISALIYYLIGKNNIKNVPNDILNKWKKDIILRGIAKRKITEAFRNIIDDIILKLNIDIIVLKGIVLKKYYPVNELRTMSDFDILIHKNDFQKVKEYLLENHFIYIEDNHPIHATFYNENGVCIEVHWKLINNENYIADTINFEKYIWDELIEFDLDGIKVKTLNKENFLLHLCIHMAKHLRNSGFGLRQLYDIVLFCNKEKDNIDWNIFESKCSECGALKFSVGLFKLINKLFNLNFFEEALRRHKLDNYDSEVLFEEILSYDKYNEERRNISIRSAAKIRKENKKILFGLFPKEKDLKRDFPYAINKFMLIVAWFHRLLKKLIEKFKKICIGKNLRIVIKRRKLLLDQFDL